MSKLPVRIKQPRRKGCYVGAPAIFKIEQCCSMINRSWGRGDAFGCYLVGSCLDKPDWRDVDVRMIMSDAGFQREFPDVPSVEYCCWEHDPKWVLLTVAISDWMRVQTGLPIDFQFQPQAWANKHHANHRSAMGLTYVSPRDIE